MKHRVTDHHILTLKICDHKVIRQNNRKNISYTHVVKFLNRKEMKIQEKLFNSLNEAEVFISKFDDDDTIDITIEDYLKLDTKTKDNLVLFKTSGINWTKKEVEMEPYLLGLWLGNGFSNGSGFALKNKQNLEILDYWEKWAQENEAKITKNEKHKYSVVSQKNKEETLDEESKLKMYIIK